MPSDDFLNISLAKREAGGTLRKLACVAGLIDFCSNDYLGFAHSKELRKLTLTELQRWDSFANGATGSRLLSGNFSQVEALEDHIAAYHRGQSALLCNSGYDANLGLLSCIADREDTIIFDELCHASIRDGVRLSRAKSFHFRHNNIEDLKEKISHARGKTFVVVESVYSMDGDLAPLVELSALCREIGAYLIVDEAHATGIFGPRGAGRVSEFALEEVVFARVVTFGKALGCHGAAVLGSSKLREYLINFCRPFIYSTALPPHSIACISSAYALLADSEGCRERLKIKCELLRSLLTPHFGALVVPSASAINSLLVPDIQLLRRAAASLREGGFDVRPILAPTVPAGAERLRICVHEFNSEDEIRSLVDVLKSEIRR